MPRDLSHATKMQFQFTPSKLFTCGWIHRYVGVVFATAIGRTRAFMKTTLVSDHRSGTPRRASSSHLPPKFSSSNLNKKCHRNKTSVHAFPVDGRTSSHLPPKFSSSLTLGRSAAAINRTTPSLHLATAVYFPHNHFFSFFRNCNRPTISSRADNLTTHPVRVGPKRLTRAAAAAGTTVTTSRQNFFFPSHTGGPKRDWIISIFKNLKVDTQNSDICNST